MVMVRRKQFDSIDKAPLKNDYCGHMDMGLEEA